MSAKYFLYNIVINKNDKTMNKLFYCLSLGEMQDWVQQN